MELSIRFIANKLAFSYEVETLNGEDNPKFATVRLYDAALSVSTKFEPIVIVPARFGPECVSPAFGGVIWLGKDRPMCKQPTIWIKDPVNEHLVLDRVQNIFDMHGRWCDSVREMLLEKRAFSEVVPLLGQVTANPYYYADASFRTLSIKEDNTLYASSSSWRMQSEIGRHPVEILSEFIASGELNAVNERRDAWLFKSETFHTPFVSRTVFCQEDVFGHLFIVQIYPEQEVFDIEILEMFGKMLEDYLNLSSLSYSSTGRPFEPLLVNHSLGIAQSAAETDYLLKLLSWRADDSYRVVAFEQGEGAASGLANAAKVELQAIEDNAPNGRAFLHDGRIVCIVNASLPESVASEKMVRGLCERFGMRAAESNTSPRFDSIPFLLKRAIATLDIGPKIDAGKLVYSYVDYRLNIAVSQLAQNTSADFLMHEDLRALIEYDRENDGELVETLKVYLDNDRKAARTAEKMFLHRNSVLYRLGKIHALITSDLDDPDNRLFLMLSIRVWQSANPARLTAAKE